MRTKYKPWAKPYIDEHPEVGVTNEELSSLEDFVLEIGSGKGEFLIQMAEKFPSLYFVGVEKNVTCAGISAKRIVESELPNAKIIFSDAINVLPLIKDGKVKTIFLNFSDPWPKKRHHKRRLTNHQFLDEYYRVLAKGGRLIFKTDNVDLFTDSLEYFEESKFTLISETNDYDGSEEFDSCTEYEKRHRDIGDKISRVVFEK